jgi:hypothetical protein
MRRELRPEIAENRLYFLPWAVSETFRARAYRIYRRCTAPTRRVTKSRVCIIASISAPHYIAFSRNAMTSATEELNRLFSGSESGLAPDVQLELEKILDLHGIDPQELFYKWESYSLKMGAEETKLDLKTARDFKRDLKELLEAEARSKAHGKTAEKRTVNATPRAAGGDVFGM